MISLGIMTEDEVVKIVAKYATSIGMSRPRLEGLVESLQRQLGSEQLIQKATQFAIAQGVPPEDLQDPQCVDAALVRFGFGIGGPRVEVFTDGRDFMMSRSINPAEQAR